MSVWIVRQRPLGDVRPGHVAEARRALRAHGLSDVDDARLKQALWLARALPVAIDALADARAGLRLDRLRFSGLGVQIRRPLTGGPLLVFALYAAGSSEVEVRVLERPDEGGAPIEKQAPVVVRLQVEEEAPATSAAVPDVTVHRFVHGKDRAR